jgi:hypothetical protein
VVGATLFGQNSSRVIDERNFLIVVLPELFGCCLEGVPSDRNDVEAVRIFSKRFAAASWCVSSSSARA